MEGRIQQILMTPFSQLTVITRGGHQRYHITFCSSRFVGWSLPATELSDFDFRAQASCGTGSPCWWEDSCQALVLCFLPGLCCRPIRALRVPRRNRPQSRLSCSHENISDMPRMLAYSSHVSLKFSAAKVHTCKQYVFREHGPACSGCAADDPGTKAPLWGLFSSMKLQVIVRQHCGPAKRRWLGWSA